MQFWRRRDHPGFGYGADNQAVTTGDQSGAAHDSCRSTELRPGPGVAGWAVSNFESSIVGRQDQRPVAAKNDFSQGGLRLPQVRHSSLPVWTSQMRAVSSMLVESTFRPFGLNSTLIVSISWPASDASTCQLRDPDELNRTIGGGEQRAARRKGQIGQAGDAGGECLEYPPVGGATIRTKPALLSMATQTLSGENPQCGSLKRPVLPSLLTRFPLAAPTSHSSLSKEINAPVVLISATTNFASEETATILSAEKSPGKNGAACPSGRRTRDHESPAKESRSRPTPARRTVPCDLVRSERFRYRRSCDPKWSVAGAEFPLPGLGKKNGVDGQ